MTPEELTVTVKESSAYEILLLIPHFLENIMLLAVWNQHFESKPHAILSPRDA